MKGKLKIVERRRWWWRGVQMAWPGKKEGKNWELEISIELKW